jgi:hypothetical protein
VRHAGEVRQNRVDLGLEGHVGVDLGSVEFYTGPVVLGGPDDLEQVVIEFITGAKKELLVAVQELDSRAVAEALIAALTSTDGPKVPRGVSPPLRSRRSIA